MGANRKSRSEGEGRHVDRFDSQFAESGYSPDYVYNRVERADFMDVNLFDRGVVNFGFGLG